MRERPVLVTVEPPNTAKLDAEPSNGKSGPAVPPFVARVRERSVEGLVTIWFFSVQLTQNKVRHESKTAARYPCTRAGFHKGLYIATSF
jgi:hypothetical protein